MLLALSLAGGARAEVVASAPGGFMTRTSTVIAAPPEKVWAGLLAMPRWWSPAHTYSGKGANLSLAAVAGGCFCERLERGGGVQHATVVNIQPGEGLVLSGGLGPLQGEGVSAGWTWRLEGTPGGTRVTQTMVVGGWSATGLEGLAAPVDGVLAEQQGRLKRFVETGSPE